MPPDYADLAGTGMRAAGTTAVDEGTRERARHNLAAIALDQDDPAAWLHDMVDALGLLPARSRRPGRCRECGHALATSSPQRTIDRQRRNQGLCAPCGRLVEEA
jgi:uncharacterized protein with PIN domain